MAVSYFFYDLETSGFSPREARIMQFAGQRTDINLQPIGEPINVLIKLSPDVLPDPDAVMLTGITPQATLLEGLTEAEFLKLFYETVVRPETVFLGYNSIRFDDEFMRFLHYRNFYDAYEWQWANGCSRWDLLDLVRMTRALRPDGIKWPVTAEGKPTNRLELLTKLNSLDHNHAHDALSDVHATIAIAQLLHARHPDLYKYLFDIRGKKSVGELVQKAAPFIYTTGRYPSSVLHTTAAVLLAPHPQPDSSLVYDLRHDPTPFVGMKPTELAACWQFTKDPAAQRLPVKTLKYNRCPAVAPLGVMNSPETEARLGLTISTLTKHLEILKKHQAAFAASVLDALTLLDREREQAQARTTDQGSVDSQLYDGFFGSNDKSAMRLVRTADPATLSSLEGKLSDRRLKALLPLYKARNYPAALNADERAMWDAHIRERLFSGGQASRLASYFDRLQTLSKGTLSADQQYALEELRLYGESVMPTELET